MLTGAVATLAPSVATVPPDFASADAAPDSDAALLRRLGRAARLRAAWHAAREAAGRLFMATYNHPDFSRPRGMTRAGRAEFDRLAARTGFRAAADRAGRIYDLCVRAATRAFALPTKDWAGLAAKLRRAAAIARDAGQGGATDEEQDWFDLAVADLERRVASR
jgi:hypothetical protein